MGMESNRIVFPKEKEAFETVLSSHKPKNQQKRKSHCGRKDIDEATHFNLISIE